MRLIDTMSTGFCSTVKGVALLPELLFQGDKVCQNCSEGPVTDWWSRDVGAVEGE